MASISKNQQNVLDFASQGDIRDGILEMPTLWSLDKNGNYRYWNLNIGIENPDTGKMEDVTQDYIERKNLPKGFSGVYWTQSGVENTVNPIISEKTFINEGKYMKNGKPTSKSYTTPFTQAILDARSDFNFKIRKGSVLEKELLNPIGQIVSIEDLIKQPHRGSKPWRVFAMALHDVNKANNWRHIKYPCKIQPKLDGTMFIVVYHPKLPAMELSNIGDKNETITVKMDSYSRGKEAYEGQDHILLELYPVLKKYPGLHITGELWKPGYGLQDISGSSRRQLDSKIKTDAIKLDFNVFDCFYIDQPEQTFEEREAILDDIMTELDTLHATTTNERHVKLIPSYIVENKEQLLEKYQLFLEEKMEGAVIRNMDSPYEVGIDKERRSYFTLKIKPRPDSEWPVYNFKDGKGKESGAVIWICAENDEGVKQRLNTDKAPPLSERKHFSITPNLEYETRYKIFEKFSKDPKFFEEKIRGQLLTINYSILSKDFIPQQPKVLRFRDPKINKLLEIDN